MTADEDALHERVAALETTVEELVARLDGAVNRDIPLLKGTGRALVDAEIDDIGDIPDAGRAFNRRVDTQAERIDAVERQLAALGDVASIKTTKEEKLAAVCRFAQNKGGQQSTIAVTAAEIQGCVGVSRRYAYDLIDEAAEALDAARVREATDVQTSTDVEHKKKALLVDCEELHAAAGGVNEFTTRNKASDSHTTEGTTRESDHYTNDLLDSGRRSQQSWVDDSWVRLERRSTTLREAAAVKGH